MSKNRQGRSWIFRPTFTGVVEKVEGDPKQVNLVYTLEADCVWKSKDGATHTFTPLQVPKDTVLTAFYMGSTKKSKGEKATEHSVIAISLAEINGKKSLKTRGR